jgi:hypothetical protein
VERLSIVELITGIYYRLLEADSNSDPSLELINLEPDLDLVRMAISRLEQGEPFSIATAGFLNRHVFIDGNGGSSIAAPFIIELIVRLFGNCK